MTRDEWKALHHSLRTDMREFKAQYGGYPCMARRFRHNGIEWTLDRYTDHDHREGVTRLWCILADQPRALRASRLKDLRAAIVWAGHARRTYCTFEAGRWTKDARLILARLAA